MPRILRAVSSAAAAILALALVAPAGAAEKLRVGKAVAFAWTFTPLDVGIQMGIFAKHGIEVEASAFNGDARLQQGLTSDSVDIGIGSGPGMAFMVKGVPAKAVGVMAGVPRNMAVMVGYDSPIKTVDDLKGKKLGVTTVPVGGMPPARAAIKTNQIDGYIGALEVGISLEEAKEWRVITSATPFVDHFITHVFFVREDVIAKRPQAVKAFLQGWQDTIAFMKANKVKTVEITSKVIQVAPSVIERAYDQQIGIFSDDLSFDPRAVAVLKESFIEMGLLKDIPEDKAMFTTQFLPVKAGL